MAKLTTEKEVRTPNTGFASGGGRANLELCSFLVNFSNKLGICA